MRTLIAAFLLSFVLAACSSAAPEAPAASSPSTPSSSSTQSEPSHSAVSEPKDLAPVDPDPSSFPGSGHQDPSTPEPADGPIPDPVCIWSDPTRSQPDFVGLSVGRAVVLAESRGLNVREVGRDGECFVVTDDLRNDRVNFEIHDDVVVAAAIY